VPTYEYQCTECQNTLEAVQSFSDDPLTVCPSCGASALRKRFGNVGVVFKGSGFYRNDSRNDKDGKSSGQSSRGDSAASGTKTEGGGDSDTPAKPKTDSAAATKSDSKAKSADTPSKKNQNSN
jgi:putative FmdB family regulatory protein